MTENPKFLWSWRGEINFDTFLFWSVQEFVARLDWALIQFFLWCVNRDRVLLPIIPVWHGRLVSEFITSRSRWLRRVFSTHTQSESSLALLTTEKARTLSSRSSHTKSRKKHRERTLCITNYNFYAFMLGIIMFLLGMLSDQFFIYT